MLCLAKQVCKLQRARSREGTRGVLSLCLHSSPLFFKYLLPAKKKKQHTGINRHSHMTGLMFNLLVTKSESLWKLMACSVLKETLPEQGELHLPAFALLLSALGLMENIGFLFCQSCLSRRHWIHFNQSHKLLTNRTQKVQHVPLTCTYVLYLLKHQLFTLFAGQMLRRWNPPIVPSTSITMQICNSWVITFSRLSHIYIYRNGKIKLRFLFSSIKTNKHISKVLFLK